MNAKRSNFRRNNNNSSNNNVRNNFRGRYNKKYKQRNNNRYFRGRFNQSNRRGRPNFARRTQTDRNQNLRLNEIDKKVSELSKELKDKCIIEEQNKKKEPRKIPTAYSMFQEKHYISFLPTELSILHYCLYNKWNIKSSAANAWIWFPYAYPFLRDEYKVNTDNQVDCFSTFQYTQLDNGSMYLESSALVPYEGLYRVVASTMRISNVTSQLNRSGEISIYRVQSNEFYPQLCSVNGVHTGVPATYLTYLSTDFNNASEKIVVPYTKTVEINEWNTMKGTDIFQYCDEYCGQKYPPASTMPYLTCNNVTLTAFNPIGPNIKYVIKNSSTSAQQEWVIETWQVYDVVPDPKTNLQSSTQLQQEVLSEKQRQSISKMSHFKTFLN